MPENENNTESTENIGNTENTDDIETAGTPEITGAAETAGTERPARGPFKDSVFGIAATLGLITVITVFAISMLNSVTSPVIEKRLHDEKEAAIIWLFGLGVEYETLTGFEDIYSDFGAPVKEVFLIRDENKLGYDKTAGYCVMVAPKGFTSDIIMLVAVSPNITVKDTLILSMSETAGYGTKIDSEGDGWFREQFKNKTRGISDVRVEPATDENAVQIIAGATVTSRAFLKGVNAALEAAAAIRERLRAAPSENPDGETETENEEGEVGNDG